MALVNIYFDTAKSATVPSFNVGQTRFAWEHRHRGTDYGKAKQYGLQFESEYIRCRWWEDVSTRDDGKDGAHDKIIHQWLVKQVGIERLGDAKNAETFKYDPKRYNLDIIGEMIHEQFFAGKEKVYEEFKPRPYQQKFLNKIAWCTSNEFLLFAKCRAGKSAMVLKHIVDTNYKVSLVCSLQKSPEGSWKDDSNKYFPSVKYVSLKDPGWETYLEYWRDRDVNVVLWGTVQSCLKRLDKIKNVDFVAFDESHVGGNAKMFNTLREELDTRICYISGTAHKLALKFPEDNQKFVYTYLMSNKTFSEGSSSVLK